MDSFSVGNKPEVCVEAEAGERLWKKLIYPGLDQMRDHDPKSHQFIGQKE